MCPRTENLIKNTEQIFESNNLGNVTYRQWTTTDRSALETAVQSCSDLLRSFA
jgi:hypothetical protein